jgi:hypothetical protein
MQQSQIISRFKIFAYGVITLISYLCGVGILSLMIWNADLVGRAGFTGNLYYLILLLMGLAAAGFLFSVLRSYALYSGKKLGRMLELSCSAVAFLLVVIFVLAIKPPPRENEVKIGDKFFLHSQQRSYVIRHSGLPLTTGLVSATKGHCYIARQRATSAWKRSPGRKQGTDPVTRADSERQQCSWGC